MKRSWMDIIQRDGNGPVGPTLVRLAQMAEAIHMAESAQRVPAPPEAEPAAARSEPREAQG